MDGGDAPRSGSSRSLTVRQTGRVPALITWWSQDVAPLVPSATHEAVVDAGARLLAAWTEPHRAYHSTRHLVEPFWALEELAEAGAMNAGDAPLLRVAGWFHDAAYDPTAGPGSNERASAALARRELEALGAADAVVAEVERLVLLTIDHRAEGGDGGHGGDGAGSPPGDDASRRRARAFCDADLWILAADGDRYAEYTAQVRQEYAHVPDDAFRAGRRAVLEHLAEGSVYATSHARRAWGPAAARNVTGELADRA